jgi:VIT1/CCC1 family predicted Fe2+/Mn2+ transporter
MDQDDTSQVIPAPLGKTQQFLKQIVYGGNDGIVTTFAIVAGFAGASAEGVAQIGALAVLVFGLANLFADAVSMGLGEFLSARSQNDLYNSRHQAELREIGQRPSTGAKRIVGFLQARGLNDDDAKTMATILSRHPRLMADMIMSYEHGMHDPDDDNPAINGLFTFVSFVCFGAVPLLPYMLFAPSQTTFVTSVAATFLALVGLGLLRFGALQEKLLRSVGETVLVGGVCALVAFGVGWLVGA